MTPVDCPDDDPSKRHGDGDNQCYCIGIAKYAGKWRLCLGEYNEYHHFHHDEPISWCPITDCTMEERTIAAQYVGKLENEIVDTGEKMLPKLNEAIRHLEERLGIPRRPSELLAGILGDL